MAVENAVEWLFIVTFAWAVIASIIALRATRENKDLVEAMGVTMDILESAHTRVGDLPDYDSGSDGDSDETTHHGEWLGKVRGLQIREPGPDADGPLVEFHGERGMAAMEVADKSWVEALKDASDEIGWMLKSPDGSDVSDPAE